MIAALAAWPQPERYSGKGHNIEAHKRFIRKKRRVLSGQSRQHLSDCGGYYPVRVRVSVLAVEFNAVL